MEKVKSVRTKINAIGNDEPIKCEKCGNVIAEPKELIKVQKDSCSLRSEP